MSDHQSTLKKFMPAHVRQALGNLPTTHQNCMAASAVKNEKGQIITLGVARPGKTKRDLANGMIPHRKNRRVWDNGSKTWVKV